MLAEVGVPTREIAEAIGRAFDLPVASIAPDNVQHFGWIGTFFAVDLAATSTATRDLLGWTPSGPTVIEDINGGAYSARRRWLPDHSAGRKTPAPFESMA